MTQFQPNVTNSLETVDPPPLERSNEMILIAVTGAQDSKLLSQQLSPYYQVCSLEPGTEALEQRLQSSEFDLAILDGIALDRHWQTLGQRKATHEPILLPLLLVSSRQNLGYVTRNLWQIVDEIIITPIERRELVARINILLRARRYSQEWQSRYFMLADAAAIGIALVQEGTIAWANRTLTDWLQQPLTALLGHPLLKLVCPEDRPRVDQAIQNSTGWLGAVTCDEVYLDLPQKCAVELRFQSLSYGDRPAILALLTDITERVNYHKHLIWQTQFDALTGLANRHRLITRLEQAIGYAQQQHHQIILLRIDLNRFKDFNDAWGQTAGDVLLRNIAQRLAEDFTEPHTVAYWGAGEFVIALADPSADLDWLAWVDHIIQRISAPCGIEEDREVSISCRVGISRYPQDSHEAESLVRKAGVALSAAKQQGLSHALYTPGLMTDLSQRVALEEALRHALERNELYLLYQPKLNLSTGRIDGAEALLRWRNPAWGEVSPGQFIPLAEATGLIYDIGAWVLREVCCQIHQWSEEGLCLGRIAVNLSGLQIQRGDLVEVVRHTMADFGIHPAQIELEVTESFFLHYNDHIDTTLRTLMDLGITLAIDDFGTGYASLAYLKHLPFNVIKIDKSFVDGLPDHQGDLAIVRAIIAMAKSLGLKTVVEGVETEDQYACLAHEEVTWFQGFWYSRPISPAVLGDLVRQQMAPP
ncbi:signal transduction protein [Leptolyngbya sp. BL0902]|uniref:putative bifunctional diguanylate cyclase/phosphodiesterase n=1 Tax=Leptolyngbya sp. BL0902 TaxID=1115757 RepID=UPI0018E84E0C|nr:EAL domain-containing protein [Leptolyngbya sp. BL0902]QQE65108.1 signal transduction protein [Leptolyngbya sp. BL0902]